MTVESAISIATVAASLISWGLAQARAIGKIEGRQERSSTDQGKRLGALEERMKEVEMLLQGQPPKAG